MEGSVVILGKARKDEGQEEVRLEKCFKSTPLFCT